MSFCKNEKFGREPNTKTSISCKSEARRGHVKSLQCRARSLLPNCGLSPIFALGWLPSSHEAFSQHGARFQLYSVNPEEKVCPLLKQPLLAAHRNQWPLLGWKLAGFSGWPGLTTHNTTPAAPGPRALRLCLGEDVQQTRGRLRWGKGIPASELPVSVFRSAPVSKRRGECRSSKPRG